MEIKMVKELTVNFTDEMINELMDSCGWTKEELDEEYGSVENFIEGWCDECGINEVVEWCYENAFDENMDWSETINITKTVTTSRTTTKK